MTILVPCPTQGHDIGVSNPQKPILSIFASYCAYTDVQEKIMSGLISNFPYNGVVTVNRVILQQQYTVDDLQ